MHVDFDAFFASVEQSVNPKLRGKPIVVCGDTKSRTTVSAASYEARPCGITAGMPISEALRRCPDLILVPGDPARYVHISLEILAKMRLLTPNVEVFSIDEAFLDLTGVVDDYDEAEEVALRFKKEVRGQFWGLTCSVGITKNKLLAKLAGKMKKPDGCVVLRDGEVDEVLRDLPVNALCGIGEKTASALSSLGITTCGELGKASEKMLSRVFGITGEALCRMGRGEDPTPVVRAEGRFIGMTSTAPVPVMKSVGHSHTLDRDTNSTEEVRRVLMVLSEKVARRMRNEGVGGRTITLTIRYHDFETHTYDTTLQTCSDNGLLIYSVAFEKYLEKNPNRRKIRLLGVSVSSLEKGRRQLRLFDQGDMVSCIDRSMDEINDRFGEFTVYRAASIPGSSPRPA